MAERSASRAPGAMSRCLVSRRARYGTVGRIRPAVRAHLYRPGWRRAAKALTLSSWGGAVKSWILRCHSFVLLVPLLVPFQQVFTMKDFIAAGDTACQVGRLMAELMASQMLGAGEGFWRTAHFARMHWDALLGPTHPSSYRGQFDARLAHCVAWHYRAHIVAGTVCLTMGIIAHGLVAAAFPATAGRREVLLKMARRRGLGGR